MRLAVDIAQVVAAVALVIALIFGALEFRSARIVNSLTVYNDAMKHIDDLVLLFVDRPELRKYFYEGAAMPAAADERAAVESIAECFVVSLAWSLSTARRLTPANYPDIAAYADYLMTHSPAMQNLARTHPDWFHELGSVLPEPQPAAESDIRLASSDHERRVGFDHCGAEAPCRAQEEPRLTRPPEPEHADDRRQQVVEDGEVAPSWREWEFWKRVIAVLTLAGVGVTVYLGLHGLREANRLQRASMDSHLGEVMMGIDRHFVVYPRLRKYFYANSVKGQTQPPRATRRRAQALSTAEMLIDFADDVASYVHERKMSQKDAAHWAGIVGPYFCESPVTRYAWKRYYAAYDSDTARILGAPDGKQKVLNWDWRANEPKASARCQYLRAAR